MKKNLITNLIKMKNKKILTWLLLTAVVVGWIWATTFANDSTNSWTTNMTKQFWRMNNLTTEQKAEMEAMKVIFDKKKAWTTLTADEQAKLDAFEANRPAWMKIGKWHWNRWWEMGWKWFKWLDLTDAEKTALATMTDTEKQTFFETKMAEQKSKMTAHENVIDKVLAWSTLTSEEETIKQEIIKERADRKSKMAEMESKMSEIKPILEKKKAWTTLTSDEQTKLDAFEAQRPEWKWFWRGK